MLGLVLEGRIFRRKVAMCRASAQNLGGIDD